MHDNNSTLAVAKTNFKLWQESSQSPKHMSSLSNAENFFKSLRWMGRPCN